MEIATDVVICGGGLAGLGLARQLRRRMPELRIVVCERQAEDPPDACFKVGESCVEGSTHWLGQTLGLGDYLFERHVKKLGLRFFGGGGRTSFIERFEIGAIDFPPVDSVQLDRGRFERDLRRLVRDDGVDVRIGSRVTAVELAKLPGGPHRIHADERDGHVVFTARWVVDATGRARMLARMLDLHVDSPHRASACWFRVEGEHDISALVSSTEREWHSRTRAPRWHSTNHLLGCGYWVWLIPLGTGHTSIGICADDRLHPFEERRTDALTRVWLDRHEPELAAYLADVPRKDFRVMRRFAHQCSRAFSAERWACVGEAAAFTDPLYSMGSDLIAWACTSVTTLIERDLRGEHDPAIVELYDSTFSEHVSWITGWYSDMYPIFEHDQIVLIKLLWDALAYFMAPVRILQYGFLDNPASIDRYRALMRPFHALDGRVQALLREWAARRDPWRAPPGLYAPGFACPSLGALANIDVSFVQGAQFLSRLAGFVDTMGELAAAIGTYANQRDGIDNPFGPGDPSLIEQLHLYLSAPPPVPQQQQA